MFNPLLVIFIVLIYVGFLFFVALAVERKSLSGINIGNNPFIYSLSLAVYCSAWTYYGSVGKAATSGMLFLAIYIGPTIAIVLWWKVMRKMIRIKNIYRITSIADFISARYNKSRSLAAIVTVVALIGGAPYVALQLKAIILTFSIITSQTNAGGSPSFYLDIGPIVVILIIIFTILFGARRLDPTERHQGMIVALTLECVVKIIAFLVAGIFVTYFLFDGFHDIFQRLPDNLFVDLIEIRETGSSFYILWITYLVLAMSAILFLPRQFHVSVIENFDEKHIRTAMWLFPLYMLLINLFVFPVAMGGLFKGLPIKEADTFLLALPLQSGQKWLSLFVFIGGFSAATGMMMISSMTMSTMVTNHLLLPFIGWVKELAFLKRYLLQCRWSAIAIYILIGYWFEQLIGESLMLVNMGMISFAAALQFAPSIIGGLFWKQGNKIGALSGLSAGFAVWAYTLVVPEFVKSGLLSNILLEEGPWGITFLRPEHLFGMTVIDPLSHAVFWTMVFNIGLYVFCSLYFERGSGELDLSEEFVNVLKIGTPAPPVSRKAFIDLAQKKKEIEELLCQYFPEGKALEIAGQGLKNLGIYEKSQISIAELTEFHNEVEKILAGSIGASAAYHAIHQGITYSPAEEKELSKVYTEILTNLKLKPAELKEKIDYYKDREMLLTQQAAELKEKIEERDREISERIRTEGKLLASETKYKTLTESSLTGIFIHQNEKFVFVNERFANMQGYKPEELIGMVYLSLIHPDDREVVRNRIEKRVIGEGRPQRYEIRRIKKDGHIIWCDTIVTLIQYEGKPAIMGNIIDSTERKETEIALVDSEEKYRTLVENVNIGVYRNSIDPHGWFIQANPAMLKIFGYDSFEDFRRISVSDLYQRSEERALFVEELSEKGFLKDKELKMRKKDGTHIWASVTASIQYDENGGIKWIDGVLEDITERKHLEDQLRHAQKMEAIGTLAGGIAHDFNNVLTAIIGYGSLLKEELGNDTHLRKYMDNILFAADRAAILVRSLLAFSRKQKLSMNLVDLNIIVMHIKSLLSRIIEENIELRIVTAPEPMIIMADAGQIEQVLMNLATNARDAMPEGGRITIETKYLMTEKEQEKMRPYIKPGEYAVLSFSDTGTGIDENIKERIFEPFFTTKEVGKGTGLGLSIIYGIVKQHDGYINVYSEIDKGTTYNIYLPIIKAELKETKPSGNEIPIKFGTETILVAEDNKEVRDLTKGILEGHGYKIIEAVDGEDAVNKFHENSDKVQFLILDVIMPKKDGREVLEEIKKTAPGIKTIFISGYTQDVIQRRGVNEEEANFVSKPLSPAELLKKIRDMLDKDR